VYIYITLTLDCQAKKTW